MRIFWKNYKKLPKRRGRRLRTTICFRRLEAPPSDPRVVTPAYYYNSFEFISSTKYVSLPSEKNKRSTTNVLFLLLPHFCT